MIPNYLLESDMVYTYIAQANSNIESAIIVMHYFYYNHRFDSQPSYWSIFIILECNRLFEYQISYFIYIYCSSKLVLMYIYIIN